MMNCFSPVSFSVTLQISAHEPGSAVIHSCLLSPLPLLVDKSLNCECARAHLSHLAVLYDRLFFVGDELEPGAEKGAFQV
eukprot:COSAG02_NODE_13433_length_1396_cov_0.919815_2_plen_80_part_00